MYIVKIDEDGRIEKIAQQMGLPYGKSAQWIAAALNETAKKTASQIKAAIRKKYTYSRGDKLKDGVAASKRKATKTNQVAIVDVRSEAPHLTDFKVKPSAPSKANYGAAKVQVYKGGGMKALIGNRAGNPKAFITQFGNSKLAVVQRVPGETYSSGAADRINKYGKSADMTRIKALFGPKITSMASTVYEESVAAETGELLQAAIKKQIDKTVKKMTESK